MLLSAPADYLIPDSRRRLAEASSTGMAPYPRLRLTAYRHGATILPSYKI